MSAPPTGRVSLKEPAAVFFSLLGQSVAESSTVGLFSCGDDGDNNNGDKEKNRRKKRREKESTPAPSIRLMEL